jgi:uncharacterized membrane protein
MNGIPQAAKRVLDSVKFGCPALVAGFFMRGRMAGVKTAFRMIVVAALFAAALIASSWLLKGTTAKDWLNAALYVGVACYLLAEIVFALPKQQK